MPKTPDGGWRLDDEELDRPAYVETLAKPEGSGEDDEDEGGE
jgi:hypothetical protein